VIRERRRKTNVHSAGMSAIGIPQFRHFSRGDLVVFSRPRLTFFARTSNYTKLSSG
jgi:hypothetical protein